MPSSRDAPGRSRQAPGGRDVGWLAHWKPCRQNQRTCLTKVPRGEAENWSLEMGGLWHDSKHLVWGPGVSRDDWRRENRSVWVVVAPQNRQSAADWAAAGIPPTIMAVYGSVWSTRRMNDLGEKDGECRFLGTGKGLHPVKVYHGNSRTFGTVIPNTSSAYTVHSNTTTPMHGYRQWRDGKHGSLRERCAKPATAL